MNDLGRKDDRYSDEDFEYYKTLPSREDEFQALLAFCYHVDQHRCAHEHRRINLSTCHLQCSDCGEALLDLNPWVARTLRKERAVRG
jgi:hypothetical protein